MEAIEPLARQFCAQVLDPLVGSGGFDFIADLGAWVPMRAIGYLLGIPEEDQAAIRNNTDGLLELTDGKELRELPPDFIDQSYQMLTDYIDWRAEHPSDDLMTQLLNAEFEEADGARRHLTRTEVLNYTGTLAGAGNETTTRLIGFIGPAVVRSP